MENHSMKSNDYILGASAFVFMVSFMVALATSPVLCPYGHVHPAIMFWAGIVSMITLPGFVIAVFANNQGA